MSRSAVPVDRMTLYQAPIVGVATARPTVIEAASALPSELSSFCSSQFSYGLYSREFIDIQARIILWVRLL